MATAPRPIPFTAFCEKVLGLRLTPGQRVLAKVAFDGLDPGQLSGSERDIARDMFGGVEVIPPGARDVLVLRCGRGSGKTTLTVAYCVYRMLTADLSGCAPGDRPAVLAVSPGRDTTEEALAKALGLVEHSVLKKDVGTRAAKRFSLKRSIDGRTVWFMARAKSMAGRSMRGISIISALIDEAEFVAPTNPLAAISDAEILNAVMPRLMTGGTMVLASTPWPAESETSKLFTANFGSPTTAVAAFAPTLALNPSMASRIEKERERNPSNALREYDCIVSDAEGSFYDSATIEAAIDRTIVPTGSRASAGLDLAHRRDSSSIVIVERQGGRVAVVYIDRLHPKPKAPLVPSQVIEQFAIAARAHGCTVAMQDSYYIETAIEVGARFGLAVVPGLRDVAARHTYLRDLLREGKLVLPNDPSLIAQLRSIGFKPKSGGGIEIVPPRLRQHGHCDDVAALTEALWLDRRFGPVVSGPRAYVPITSPAPMGSLFGDGGFTRW